ncbi:MAG: GNAT family N-acetyltransferase, partial [Paraglaciecola sp.]|nr:GNAT family N-acetyltransferase [Paraglaciecola sp.]
AKSLELRGRAADTWSATLLSDDLNAVNAAKVRMVVSLPADADILLASYKPKLRSQIKKAEKNGLTASCTNEFSALQQFYDVYSKNMHRLGSPVHRFQWFEQLWQALHQSERLFITLVYYSNKVVAAGLVLRCGHKACIPWASTLAEFNHLAPNMLLYWQIQAELANRGVSEFDMGRSTVGEGTYRFKAQWGAEPELLYWFHGSTNALALINTSKQSKIRPIVEKVWQKLPLPIATRLGAYFRKYITL